MHKYHSSADLRKQLYQFLQNNCPGHSRAIRAKDLAYKFNTNIREINDAIRILRFDGLLIGSSKEKPYGYYIPITEEDIKIYMDSYKGELFDMLSVYNRQKRARKIYQENLKSKDLFKQEASGQLVLAY